MLINSKNTSKVVEVYISPKFNFKTLPDEPDFLIENQLANTTDSNFLPIMITPS